MSLLTEDFSEAPYWNRGLGAFEPPPAEVPATADVAVVGGGYAGLSAALSLQRKGARAVVFEALGIGEGAAARAAGSLGHVPKATLADLKARYGESAALEVYREARQAREYVERLIREHQIQCGLRVGTRFVAAHSARAFERQRKSLPDLRATWGDVELLPRERQREAIGSDAFFGGVKIPNSATLQPALLHRGLARAAIGAGATVLARNPVAGVEPDGAGFRVTSAAGVCKARHVVLATNAEARIDLPALRALRRRMIAVPAFALATTEVSEETMSKVLPLNGPVSDTYKIINYIAPDDTGRRFIFSGRAGRSDGDLRTKAVRMFKYYRDRCPDLDGVRIAYCWTGRFAVTADWMPHIGVADGMHYVLGCNGVGIPMATYLGDKIADSIVDGVRERTVFDRPLPRLPLGGAENILFPLAVRGYEWRDWLFR